MHRLPWSPLFIQWRRYIMCHNPYRPAALILPASLSYTLPPSTKSHDLQSIHSPVVIKLLFELWEQESNTKKASKSQRWLTRDQHSWLGKREEAGLRVLHSSLLVVKAHCTRHHISVLLCSLNIIVSLISLHIEGIFERHASLSFFSLGILMLCWYMLCLLYIPYLCRVSDASTTS